MTTVTVDSGFVIALRDIAIANGTLERWSEVAVQCIHAAEDLVADQKAEIELLRGLLREVLDPNGVATMEEGCELLDRIAGALAPKT